MICAGEDGNWENLLLVHLPWQWRQLLVDIVRICGICVWNRSIKMCILFHWGCVNTCMLHLHTHWTLLCPEIVWKLLEMSQLNFDISTNLCPIKYDLSGNTVWRQASILSILVIFHELLSTENVKVARFAFSVIFHHRQYTYTEVCQKVLVQFMSFIDI